MKTIYIIFLNGREYVTTNIFECWKFIYAYRPTKMSSHPYRGNEIDSVIFSGNVDLKLMYGNA